MLRNRLLYSRLLRNRRCNTGKLTDFCSVRWLGCCCVVYFRQPVECVEYMFALPATHIALLRLQLSGADVKSSITGGT